MPERDEDVAKIQRFFKSILKEAWAQRLANDELAALTATIEETGGIGAVKLSEKVTGGPAPQELSNLLIRRDEAMDRLSRQQAKLFQMQRAAEKMIEWLEIPLQRSVMRQRYLCLWRWGKIAETNHYSVAHCKRQQAEAFQFWAERYADAILSSDFVKDDTQ